MFLENSELAPKLQQKKSPSNSEIVDFDHKPFLTMYKALLCQDESSLILTTTGQEKCFGKRFQREMCAAPFGKKCKQTLRLVTAKILAILLWFDSKDSHYPKEIYED